MNSKLYLFFLGLILTLTSCETASKKIIEQIRDDDNYYIKSHSLMFNESKVTIFLFPDGGNPFDNIDFRNSAIEYLNNEGLIEYYQNMANSVKTTYDSHNKLASDWFERSKEYEKNAQSYQAKIKRCTEEVIEAISKLPSDNQCKNILVLKSLSYKRYLYKSFSEPYEMSDFIIFSDNGERQLFSTTAHFKAYHLHYILEQLEIPFKEESFLDYHKQ